jgi:MFS superfamily sulfate permease-like transporter
LPEGLPAFALPWIGVSDLLPVLIGGAAVALVSFADTSVLSRAYAARLGQPVNPNQEMVGLGTANLAAGLFQGFPISSSSSRTPVAEAAGATTQVTGIVGALGVASLPVAAPDLLKHLPTPALAAVVIASAIGLIEIDDLRRIWRIQRWEFWLSILCLVGVAVLGAVPGIGLAIVIPSSSSCGTAGGRTRPSWGVPRASRAGTTSRATPMRGASPASCSSAGTRRCSSPMPSVSQHTKRMERK